ncbi:MAG: PorP/SprF family type IX secretion system membrane protein [Flavobacteriales bacterium]|nr:PorP/SprF family type IX secretion system membrane protein [Flavobacteriales bacterium]
MFSSLFCVLSILLGGSVLQAQDIHLTQFYTNQQNLNPGMVGMYDGAYRAVGNYRHQWPEINKAITTGLVGFDKKFFFFKDEIDAGILVANDNYSGYSLNTAKIFVTAAYKKVIRGHEVRAGIQMGAVIRSTDLSSQTFPDQWVYQTGIFDPSLYNGEDNIKATQAFFDMNLGFAWSHQFKKFKPTVGFSIFHINRPKDTYFNAQAERLRTRQSVQVLVDVPINSSFSAEPKLLYMWTTKVQDMVLGANVKYHIKNAMIKNIYLGIMYRGGFGRNSDAVAPVAGFHIKNFDVGLSYDFNVSKLSTQSNLKTTFELSLIYTAPLFTPKSLAIPCDRY